MIPNKLTNTEYKAMPNFVRGRKCAKLIKIQQSCLYFYTSYATFWITATIYYFWVTIQRIMIPNKLTNKQTPNIKQCRTSLGVACKCAKLIKIQQSCLYFYISYATFWITATIYYFWITTTHYDSEQTNKHRI